MNKLCLSLVLALVVFITPGCYTFQHTVGEGTSGGPIVEEAQWFVLWGLVPLNNPDSAVMAGDATDYTIKSEFSVVDVVITAFTGFLTVHKMTLTVQK